MGMKGGSKGQTHERRSLSHAAADIEVMQFIKTHEPMTPREIADAMNATPNSVTRALLRLYKQARVSRIGEIGYFTYGIGEQGDLF